MFKKTGLFVVILSFLALLEPRSSQAQEIKIDGNTATIVTKDGDRITIDGNTLSRDGKNLFHSFQEFGLSQQQIATFLTNPNIQNILTRVTGGNPSYINGLIQVVGGNSNLFLMNPAGVVFGSGASINVPADFTATTATGIGFNNGVFSAVGSNDYSNLTGNPTNFVFNTNQPGSIINAGDLKVSEGSNINLIGGNVINTGTIETPNGKINIQAVAGTSRVKITPEGSLLSLEIEIPSDEKGNVLGFTPQDLPTLLTGAHNAGVATPNITVGVNGINPADNPDKPQVQVANTTIPEGTGNSDTKWGGYAVVSGKVSTSSETLGGEITVLGQKVGLIEGEITANGAQGGGKVLIGGDREGKGTIPNAEVTYISPNSIISADATVNGDGGQVIVFAEEYANIHGELTAKGGSFSGDGGFIETSGKKSFNITSVPDTSAVNGQAGEWLIDPLDVTIVSGSGDISDSEGTFTPPGSPSNTVGVDNLKSGLFVNDTVTVTTEATIGTEEGNITWNTNANLDYDGIGTGKTLVLKADRNIIYQGTIQDSNPDTLSPDSLNVTFNSNASGNGGSIDIGVFANITTEGGNIILGGGNDPLTQPAIGTGDLVAPLDPDSRILNEGVNIFGNLSAQGGNISITGQGLLNSPVDQNGGVVAYGNSSITTTGSGTITLQGTGGSGVAGVSSSSIDNGITSGGIIQAENGNINFVGIGGSGFGNGNNGITLGGTVKTTGDGSIILIGQGNTGNGVRTGTIFDPIITTEGSGDIEIRGSSLSVSSFFSSTENTTFSTLGTGSIIFNLENEVNLGDTTANGLITINSAQDLSITGSSIIQGLGTPITGVGTTTLNSFVPVGDSTEPRDITLTGDNNFNNLVIINGQNVALNDINDIIVTPINITQGLDVRADSNIILTTGINVNGADVRLEAGGNINVSDIFTEGTNQDSGNIRLDAGGVINSIGTFSSANFTNGNGGDVSLTSAGDLLIDAGINTTSVTGNGGDISLTSTSGSINTQGTNINGNRLDASGENNGGNITIMAAQNIATDDLRVDGNLDSGGSIDLEAGGDVNINPSNQILFGSNSGASSGDFIINASGIVSLSGTITNNGANFTIGNSTAPSQITNGDFVSFNTNGGDLNFQSQSINFTNANINTNGGDITFSAEGNITTPNINASGVTVQDGGNVTLTSKTGNIQTGNITAQSINLGDNNGEGGSISINALAGSIQTGDLDVFDSGLDSNANIDLNAGTSINTASISLGASNNNSSGNLTIETPSVVTVNGNINSNGADIIIGTATPSEVNINGSVNSNGGNVTINSTGLIKIDSGAIEPTSISSGTGNIVINHGGGDLNPRVPFVVGDATVNGTSGSIVTSTESINPIQTYPNSFVTPNGTIEINTTNLIDLPIVAATLDIDGDNTGSIVSSTDGLQLDITGGTLSGNSSNLFHSFTRFDLPQSDQTANFITETSGINNILARVISGDASIINGRVQVTGLSTPNLFLMNPAGIVFGQSATINVPADFVATTATGIGFGDNWFSANGNYNASLLNVDPINLAFTATESGAIINASSLNNSNGDLSLLAGTQINTQNISNSNNLNLTAIQGQNILNLTTFALTPASESATLPNTFTPAILTLDNLVTTALSEGTGNLGVSILGNNSLQVDATEVTVGLGDVSSQAINASNTNIRANSNVTLGTVGNSIDSNTLNVNANGQLQLLGTIETQGGDISIAGVSDFISPNNINTKGGNFNLNTSSDYGLDIAVFTEGGNFNLDSLANVAINSTIDTDGGNLAVTGNSISSSSEVIIPFDSSNSTGNGGNITLTSTNGDINVSGLLSNSASGNGGEITVNASSGNITIGNVNTFGGTTGNLALNADGNIVNNGLIAVGGNTFLSGNNITLDNVSNDFQTVNLQNGVNVTLSDINDLTLANVDTLGNPANIFISGDLSLQVTGTTNINSNIQANSIATNSTGTTVINADNINSTANQTYNNSLLLAKDTTITGNNITFGSSIDSQTTPQSLTVIASENINYGDGIGDDRIGTTIGLNNFASTALDIFLNIDRSALSVEQVSINTVGDQNK